VVVSADAMWAEVLPREIKQLATNLDRCQVKEMPDISNFCLGQRPVEANQAVLENVIRLHPAT
jgi:hypothetical protein